MAHLGQALQEASLGYTDLPFKQTLQPVHFAEQLLLGPDSGQDLPQPFPVTLLDSRQLVKAVRQNAPGLDRLRRLVMTKRVMVSEYRICATRDKMKLPVSRTAIDQKVVAVPGIRIPMPEERLNRPVTQVGIDFHQRF